MDNLTAECLNTLAKQVSKLTKKVDELELLLSRR